jgi:NitT/TauT family transport system permease protein
MADDPQEDDDTGGPTADGVSEESEEDENAGEEMLDGFAAAEAAAPKPKPEPAAPIAIGSPVVEGVPAGPSSKGDDGERPPSPYDGLLRIKGDVDQTKAIALFLGGLSAFVFVWWFLTWGNPQAFQQTGVVAADGALTLSQLPTEGKEIWADGFEFVAEEGLTDRQFRLDGEQLRFDASVAGEEVTYGFTVGREPIVSHFILPQPLNVMQAVIENLTGSSYQVTCPNAECASKAEGGTVALSASDGQAVEAKRSNTDPDAASSGVTCPVCKTALDGEVVIAMPPYRYRSGLISTVKRTLIGFLIAAVLCIPLGVLAGAYPPIKRLVSPLEIAGGYTPPVALLPLAVALYGVAKNSGMDSIASAEVSRISFLVVVIAFWLYPLVMGEVESVDEVYVNTAFTLGASRTQVIMKVLVPVTMANIWGHLRTTYAIGWASIILAEGYAVGRESGETGIGFFMVDMQRRNIMENYFAAVLAIVVTGIAIDYAFKIVGRWLFPYQEGN